MSLLEPSSTNEKMAPGKGENNASPIERLWNTRWAVRRMTMVRLTGFWIGFVYYGVHLNVENLNFNLYFTTFSINAMMEIPAVFMGKCDARLHKPRPVLLCLCFPHQNFLHPLHVFSRMGDKNGSEASSKKRGKLTSIDDEAVGFMAASTAFDVLYMYCVEVELINVRNLCVPC